MLQYLMEREHAPGGDVHVGEQHAQAPHTPPAVPYPAAWAAAEEAAVALACSRYPTPHGLHLEPALSLLEHAKGHLERYSQALLHEEIPQ